MITRLPLADAALRLSLTYHQVRARVLRGELKGGRDEDGHFYVEAPDVDRALRAESREGACSLTLKRQMPAEDKSAGILPQTPMTNEFKLATARRIRYVPMPLAPLTARDWRVYLACPVSVYSTPRYERIAAIVRGQFAGASILEARNLYTSQSDWLRRWPSTVRRLTHLVFFCDPDGWIGRGVWKEITDAERAGITVLHVSDRGHFTPRAALRIGPVNEECWQRYCRVVLVERNR